MAGRLTTCDDVVCSLFRLSFPDRETLTLAACRLSQCPLPHTRRRHLLWTLCTMSFPAASGVISRESIVVMGFEGWCE